MQENTMGNGSKSVGEGFSSVGNFIMNNSGKIFFLVIVVALLSYAGYQIRTSPKKEGLTVKQEVKMETLGNNYLDNARTANQEKEYQTAYDQASLYLTGSTTIMGRVEAYLARGEAQIHLLKCKEAMSDLYMAANVSPNDKAVQARIAEKLNIIFYGKDCDGKY